MGEKKYRVSYTPEGSSSVRSTIVMAGSASQAKEKIKERERGKVKIISAVEQ